MPINSKPLDLLNESDLQDLVSDQVMENRTLEYKEALPGNSDEDKREFLADVSAFANTSGGDLVYGIRQDAGVAFEICGLEVIDIDAALLRLQNTLRTGLDPKIPGVLMKHIPVQHNRVAVVIRVPRSWALLHMVIFKGASKFFGRHSGGKYQLDVREIRDGFLFADTLRNQVQQFRYDRLETIAGEFPPIELEGLENGSMVLHIIPIEASNIMSQFDVNSLLYDFPQPLSTFSGAGRRLNFDGLLSFEITGKSRSRTRSYVQTFKNGSVEAADTTISGIYNTMKYISPEYEHKVLAGLRRLLAAQHGLGVEPPLFVGLSFLSVKGFRMGVEVRAGFLDGQPIDRDNLIVPEVVIDDYDVSLIELMKPVFDAIWNAAGWEQSRNYDSAGQWIGGRF